MPLVSPAASYGLFIGNFEISLGIDDSLQALYYRLKSRLMRLVFWRAFIVWKGVIFCWFIATRNGLLTVPAYRFYWRWPFGTITLTFCCQIWFGKIYLACWLTLWTKLFLLVSTLILSSCFWSASASDSMSADYMPSVFICVRLLLGWRNGPLVENFRKPLWGSGLFLSLD